MKLEKVKKKFNTLLYTEPDGVEVFVALLKIVWGVLILAGGKEYMSNHVFYFLSGSLPVSFFAYVLIVDAIIKLWAWWTDKINICKWMAFLGFLIWVFISVNTWFSDLPRFILIQFMVLIISDFWLYLRLGALRNVRSSSY